MHDRDGLHRRHIIYDFMMDKSGIATTDCNNLVKGAISWTANIIYLDGMIVLKLSVKDFCNLL